MSTIVLNQSGARSRLSLSTKHQHRLFIVATLISDTLVLLIAFILATVIRFQTHVWFFDEGPSSPELHKWLIVVLLPAWLLVFAAFQLYNIQTLLGGTGEYARAFNACAVVFSLAILVAFFLPVIRVSRGWITVVWLAALLLVWAERFTLRRAAYQLRRHGLLTWRTLIVGTDDEACAIAEQLQNAPTAGAEIIGFVANHMQVNPKIESQGGVVGSFDQLPTLVKSLAIEELIVSTATLSRGDLLAIFERFGNSEEVELRFSSGLYELYTAGVQVREIGNVPLVSMNKLRLDPLELTAKACMDYVMAMLGLLALAPVFLIVAILVKLDSHGPVLYRRRVLGRSGHQFDAFKFRTMYVNGDDILKRHPDLIQELKTNFKLKYDPRITLVGKWLRHFSLDELPQLVNVLCGQMSLVGPRMIGPEEVSKYGRLKMNLLTVKPGLTGLWQVSGRGDVCYEERMRLDMHYIRNYSIWLDLQILLQTIPAILKAKGAY